MLYITKEKRPKGIHVIVTFSLIAFMIGFVGLIRNGVRAGAGINSMDVFSLQTIIDAIFGNFEIFKTYYGIILHIPSEMDFTLGQQMLLYTLIMLIPRVLWPSKPEPIIRQVNTIAVSAYANIAGTAYPYVGEFYQEFGLLGIIFFSAALGHYLGKLKNYMYRNDIHSVVLYSSLYPLILQVLIRGYTPSNFYMLLFVILPVILTKSLNNSIRIK